VRRKAVPRARRDARRVAAQVNLLADLYRFDLQRRARRFQNVKRRVHNFRADAVAVRHRDGNVLCHDLTRTFR
jgi:hypothetical protein